MLASEYLQCIWSNFHNYFGGKAVRQYFFISYTKYKESIKWTDLSEVTYPISATDQIFLSPNLVLFLLCYSTLITTASSMTLILPMGKMRPRDKSSKVKWSRAVWGLAAPDWFTKSSASLLDHSLYLMLRLLSPKLSVVGHRRVFSLREFTRFLISCLCFVLPSKK